MKLKFFLIITFILSIKFSYSGEISIYHYSFADNSETYLFGDSVRVRKDPDPGKQNVTDTLPAGYKIWIVSKTDRNMVINGYKEFWYKISYKKNNTIYNGYIWGGLLSICYAAKGEKLFLAGIKKYDNENGFTAECRLVEKGKLLSSVEFKPHYLPDGLNDGVYGYTVSAELKNGLGLDEIENVFKINFNFQACGYPGGSVWIGYGKDAIYYIGKDTSISEAGVFHVEERYIFPADQKDVKDRVVLVNESFNFDETLNDYKLVSRKETKFKWQNNKLIPVN